MSAKLEVQGVSYSYPDGTSALVEVSFVVQPGECVGLVGPSGAGKSSLAMCMVGFNYAQQGRIFIGDIEVNKKSVKEVRKKVGMIFQNPDDQLFMPTLFDDVAFGPLQRGVNGSDLEDLVTRALADRGLLELSKKFPGHLSGGQKRLAALAGVLVMEPEVLILDEPSSNLDPRSRRELIHQLADLKNTRLIAGHDLEMVLDLCSRVYIMNKGKLVAEGSPSELLADKELMAANSLEVPHSLLPHRHTEEVQEHLHSHTFPGKKIPPH